MATRSLRSRMNSHASRMERIMAVSGQWTGGGRSRSNPPRDYIDFIRSTLGEGAVTEVLSLSASPAAPISIKIKKTQAEPTAPVEKQVQKAVEKVAENTADAITSIQANIDALKKSVEGRRGRRPAEYTQKLADLEAALKAAKEAQKVVTEVRTESAAAAKAPARRGRPPGSGKKAAPTQPEVAATAQAVAQVKEAVEASNVVQEIAENVADAVEEIAAEENIEIPIVDSQPEPVPPVTVSAPVAAEAAEQIDEELAELAAALGVSEEKPKVVSGKSGKLGKLAGLFGVKSNGRRVRSNSGMPEQVQQIILKQLRAKHGATADEAQQALKMLIEIFPRMQGDPVAKAKEIMSKYAQIMEIVRAPDEEEEEVEAPAPAPTRHQMTDEEAEAEIKRLIVLKIKEMLGLSSDVKANRRRR